ncbi:hypothetical protein [Pseudomonas aeruginosa]|uniref:hypothetical protein n=1 Tax=Pseudomonas aeruginosa TaxID=287 RepID=UPI000F7F9C62|nr:hypothetical protein [Pseudomonas aeruginosa]RTB44095.1 hypothetical protein EJ655_08120 [Pseudomonas aeruginosa]
MLIDLASISDAGLAELIAQASQELHRRLVEQGPQIVRVPAPAAKVVIDEPPADDKDHALQVKAMLKEGHYIKAAERSRIKEIADKYPAWIRMQQLPTGAGTGEWREAQRFHSTVRARER